VGTVARYPSRVTDETDGEFHSEPLDAEAQYRL
jgi:hypothetical protein